MLLDVWVVLLQIIFFIALGHFCDYLYTPKLLTLYTMTPFERIPLLRVFIPFIAGVFAAPLATHSPLWLWAALIATVAYVLSHLLLPKQSALKQYQLRWLPGMFLSVAFALSALVLVHNSNTLERPTHFSNLVSTGHTVFMEVSEPPALRPSSVKAVFEVKAVKLGFTWYKTSGKVMQYFEKDSASTGLCYGQRTIQKADFKPVTKPANPHEFDYQKYLANNGIYHRSFVRSGDWFATDGVYGNPLLQMAGRARSFLLSRLEHLSNDTISYGLISALLLGMSDNLDADTLKSFSAAGAIHVLCVSGLHVGIFYLMFSTLLGFLDRKRWGRLLKMLLLLGAIWAYAMITGLAPSVMRASTMFSVMIIARYINRNTCIYNTMLFSAMLLIVFDTGIVSKPGFWLSYLAVAGIVYMYPKFYNALKIKNKWLEKLWSLACVSLAAQLATSPLSVYYFGMFPNYFLISNIIVVPLATIIVYMGSALLALSYLPYVSEILFTVLGWLLNSLYFVVYGIGNLPASISSFYISLPQMLLLYVFLGLLSLYFEVRKTVYLKLALLGLIVVLGMGTVRRTVQQNKRQLIAYSLSNGFAMDIINGSSALFIADEAVLNNPVLVSMHISGYRKAQGVKSVHAIPVEQLPVTDTLWNNTIHVFHSFMCTPERRLFMPVKKQQYFPGTTRMETDIHIYRGGGPKYTENILKTFYTSMVLLSRSLPHYVRPEMQDIKRAGIEDVYNLRLNGAFVLAL